MKAEFVRVTLFSNVYERAEELAAVRVERRESCATEWVFVGKKIR